MITNEELSLLKHASERLSMIFDHLPEFETAALDGRTGSVLCQLADRLVEELPFPHPLYAGHMMKPPHPVARLAYVLSSCLNTNNHSLDGGRATTHMELESVAAIAEMLGFESHVGHLCSGGMVANLEALWVASKCKPNSTVVASDATHYVHARACDLLRLELRQVHTDAHGRMDLARLRRVLDQGDVGIVVATAGTTSLGAVDPLAGLADLAKEYGFFLHVDAAYGGYHRLADGLPEATAEALESIGDADSVVVDPHKHGLQPYGCSCVLFKNRNAGTFLDQGAPYVPLDEDGFQLYEQGLECSRSGASAAALWATQRLLPLVPDGEFARGLTRSVRAAQRLYGRLSADPRFLVTPEPQLDIVVWAPAGRSSGVISSRSRALVRHASRRHLHLSLVDLPASMLRQRWSGVRFDESKITCVRTCLMKPEHLRWEEAIWQIISEAVAVPLNAAGAE